MTSAPTDIFPDPRHPAMLDNQTSAPANVVFRRATNADCMTAQRIVRDALRDHGLDLLPDTSDKDLFDLEAHYEARGGGFELIVLTDSASGSNPVGVLGWRPGADGTLELKKVYLDRAARGRSLGRLAVERVIAIARNAGYSAVVLETTYGMTDAIRLYTRLGFRPVSGAEAGSFAVLSPQSEQAFRLDLTR